ncbi:flagellar hook-length control protein FliK [Pseudoalteromonas ulvae]|uniref:Flagellar hook-length control protein-like C-terminal domain-containing protein n=1 Tax=Pseudoalteromonas ulvae TaxID=107327 RepID=A0A244CSI7_PSEDV|nr:flagellar hook-length control protein FliK [Pseudoalteromonas ulvae]OUL58561.1 hypothetical protein B1199_09575 [Pseudoalteromonas ulvae]
MASISNNVTLALNIEQKQSAESNLEQSSEGGSEFSSLYSQSMTSQQADKQTAKQVSQAEDVKSGNNSPLMTADLGEEDEAASSEVDPLLLVSETGKESASDKANLKHENLTDTISQLLNQLHDSANATVSVNHFFNSAQIGDLLIDNNDNQLEIMSEHQDGLLAFSSLMTDKQALHSAGDESSEILLGQNSSLVQASDLLDGLKEKMAGLSSSQRQELSQKLDLAMDNLAQLAEEMGVDKQLLSDVLKQLQAFLSSEFISAPVDEEGFGFELPKSISTDMRSDSQQNEAQVRTSVPSVSADTLSKSEDDLTTEVITNAAQIIEQAKDASKAPNSSHANQLHSQNNQGKAEQTSSLAVNAKMMDMSDTESQHTPKLQADSSLAGVAAQSNKDAKQVEQAFNALIDKMLTDKTNSEQVRVPGLLSASSSEGVSGDTLSNLYSPASLNQLTQQRSQLMQPAPTEAQLQQPLNILRTEAAKELHDRVTFMLGLNKKEAEIRLDPPELGSMQIRVRSDAEQAQINFVVQSQQAKEALEQSLPRLREMLAEQGIQLGESSIEQQSESNDESNDGSDASHNKQHADTDEEIEQTSHISARIAGSRVGGVDFYA